MAAGHECIAGSVLTVPTNKRSSLASGCRRSRVFETGTLLAIKLRSPRLIAVSWTVSRRQPRNGLERLPGRILVTREGNETLSLRADAIQRHNSAYSQLGVVSSGRQFLVDSG